MEEIAVKFLFTFAFLVVVPTLNADIAHHDEVWQKRALSAKNASGSAFHTNPMDVTNDLNKRVHKALRRNLHDKNAECSGANPIDACWRCQPDWAKDRKKLADCVIGFGRGTKGGKDGRIYVVNDPSDNDLVNPRPGTLRHAVIQAEPLWITFARDMQIKLKAELVFASHKTVDGRGANVHICNGAGLTLQFVKDIIIHGIHVHDIKKANGGLIRDSVNHYGPRSASDGDAVYVFGSTNIWIDHVSFSKAIDGLIDVTQGSTAITVSNCLFTEHDKVMLLGGSDSSKEDKIMQVTVAFNRFGHKLVQRMPRTRFGFFHIVNNDYNKWKMYAIGGSSNPTIISEGNRYEAPDNHIGKQVTKRDAAPESVWRTWTWRSQGDFLLNGAYFVQSGNPITTVNKKDLITAKPGESVPVLTRFAGALNCRENQPC